MLSGWHAPLVGERELSYTSVRYFSSIPHKTWPLTSFSLIHLNRPQVDYFRFFPKLIPVSNQLKENLQAAYCLRAFKLDEWEVCSYTMYHNFRNVTLSLSYPKTLGNGCAQFKSPFLLSHLPLIYHNFWHKNNPPKNSTHMPACIIIIIIMLSFLQCWLCVIS